MSQTELAIQATATGSDDELWRITFYEKNTGETRPILLSNVTRAQAAEVFTDWSRNSHSRLEFTERTTGVLSCWLLSEIDQVRIMPMREVI